jgi:hypothetical protein
VFEVLAGRYTPNVNPAKLVPAKAGSGNPRVVEGAWAKVTPAYRRRKPARGTGLLSSSVAGYLLGVGPGLVLAFTATGATVTVVSSGAAVSVSLADGLFCSLVFETSGPCGCVGAC